MALTQVDQGLLGQYAQYTGFKNRIINGAMVIDQRAAGASTTPATVGAYTYASCDRFFYLISAASKFTMQQNAGSVTPPVGFGKYLGCTVGASANVTVGASDYYMIGQAVEGFNTADLAWGTVDAKAVTLSFQVYSSLTGTFGGVIINSASNYSYPFTYTVSSANTWTSISLTVAGPTSGTWIGATNGIGMRVIFSLGMGSNYSATANTWASGEKYSATGAAKIIETNSATFYITGVQLEKGSTATSFDYRPYGTELALCQRYYEVSYYNGNTTAFDSYFLTSTFAKHFWYFAVAKRAKPTVTLVSGAWSNTTPSFFPEPNYCHFANASGFFYAGGTADAVAASASSEL